MEPAKTVVTEKSISELQPVKKIKDGVRLEDTHDIFLVLNKLFSRRVLLTVAIKDSDLSYGSTILEIKEDEEYLVLDELYPTEGHKLIETGVEIDINAQLNGAFIYFKSIIEAISENDNTAYYKVHFPDELYHYQRRGSFRVSVNVQREIPVSLTTEDNVLISAELRDISLGGVSLRCKEISHAEIKKGDHIPTCMIHTDKKNRIIASLDICHVEKIIETGTLRIGAVFTSMNKADEHRLEHFIALLERAIIKKHKAYRQ